MLIIIEGIPQLFLDLNLKSNIAAVASEIFQFILNYNTLFNWSAYLVDNSTSGIAYKHNACTN